MKDWNVRDYPKKEKWVEALNALVLSIEKWEKIVTKTGIDMGTKNCELCKIFYGESSDTQRCCVGCPISEEVDDTGCISTPWDVWESHHRRGHYGLHQMTRNPMMMKVEDGCVECVKLAVKELEFLQSLLPEGERKV